ncbi:MAG: hypothetical protein FJX44_10030 [Alphaproteobacteria bacterium]|nr:hypothetical protein [Alphaproteobacteria bacterium]
MTRCSDCLLAKYDSIKRPADRRSLLLGTALVSTLWLGSAFAPVPAAAQSIVIETFEQVNNAKKLNVTLEADIVNENILEVNDDIFATVNIGIITNGNLNQSLDADQSVLVLSDIVVNNSGEIDPPIGILAAIDNQNIALANLALSVALDLGVVVGGNLTQSITSNQTNAITNNIDLNNNAKVTATQIGIFTPTLNENIALANLSAVILANVGSLVGGNIVQTGSSDQANGIITTTNIVNSGEIDPEIGIVSLIDNQNIAAANLGLVAAANIATLTDGDVTQRARLGQTNTITSQTGVGNSGAVTADEAGIFTFIDNQIIALTNIGAAAAVNVIAATGGDVTQSAALNQKNTLASGANIVNSGEIDSNIGLLGAVNTDNAALSNIGGAFTANAIAANGEDVTQSARLRQSNAITGHIGIDNGGKIDADDAGIFGLINNRNIALANIAIDANINLIADTVGDLAQSLEAGQANKVASHIDIVNSGDVRARNIGIGGVIINENIAFANIGLNGDLNIVTTIGGDVTQSADIDQSNRLVSRIGIANSGNVHGNNIGIGAQIDNQNILFANAAAAGVLSVASTIGDDLSQTAAIRQRNSIESFISVKNSGSVFGGDVGIFASIVEPVFAATNDAVILIDADGRETLVRNTVISSGITIHNTGTITAGSLLAIDTEGASTTIINTNGGVIEGFIDLTDRQDLFDNKSGGTLSLAARSKLARPAISVEATTCSAMPLAVRFIPPTIQTAARQPPSSISSASTTAG